MSGPTPQHAAPKGPRALSSEHKPLYLASNMPLQQEHEMRPRASLHCALPGPAAHRSAEVPVMGRGPLSCSCSCSWTWSSLRPTSLARHVECYTNDPVFMKVKRYCAFNREAVLTGVELVCLPPSRLPPPADVLQPRQGLGTQRCCVFHVKSYID